MKPDPVRGHLGGLLLAAVEREPLHGYAIITAVRLRSGGALELRTGTIYPALNRLERLGLVRSVWTAEGGRRRRSYEITEAGRRSLADERSAWQAFTASIGSVLDPAPGTP
jgi:PadR family transcriptional regulator PadR